MKKLINFFLITFIFFFTPSIVKACSYSDISRLKKLVSNISFSYDYIEEGHTINFSVTINNMHNDVYFIDATSGETYYKGDTDEIVINGYGQGSNIRYIFYGNTGTCKDIQLSIQYVTLPYYNIFYKDDLCKGLEEFKLCQKWTTVGIKNYSEFKKEIYNYLKSLEGKEPTDETVVVGESIFSIILGYLLKYYYVVLIIIIVVCLFAMYRLSKKDSFDF